ncbi:MAG: hypothetical protein ACRDI2_04655 [Chloroflexota bacterium]
MGTRFSYTVSEADEMVSGFLTRAISREELLDWAESCDWDDDAPIEPSIRELVGRALLYLHEEAEGARAEEEVRAALEDARQQLLTRTA